MGVCNCVTPYTIPLPTTGLNSGMKVKRGGAKFIAVAACDYEVFTVTSKADWDAAIVANEVQVIRDCMLQVGLTNDPQTEEVGSCPQLIPTRNTFKLTVRDITDNTTSDRHKLWAGLHGERVKVAFGLCDGDLYTFRSATVVSNFTIEDTTNGKTFWTVEFQWDADKMDTPAVSGIAQPNFIDSISIPN